MCILNVCISICKNHEKMSLFILPFDISRPCMYIWFVSISVSCYKVRRGFFYPFSLKLTHFNTSALILHF